MNIEQKRAHAQKLCKDSSITVLPYGNAWWLLGDGINLVVGELAGLSPASLRRIDATQR
jgi:hypothetical protein